MTDTTRLHASRRTLVAPGPAVLVPAVLVLAVLGLGLARPAAATLQAIEQAYELTRNQVQLPARPEGGLTIRQCPTCRPVVLRVTAATAWFDRPGSRQPAGQAAVLAAYRAAATQPGTFIHVYYEPQSRRVKRIVLDTPAPAVRP